MTGIATVPKMSMINPYLSKQKMMLVDVSADISDTRLI